MARLIHSFPFDFPLLSLKFDFAVHSFDSFPFDFTYGFTTYLDNLFLYERINMQVLNVALLDILLNFEIEFAHHWKLGE